MVRTQLGACADSLLCRATWRPQTACQIYDCLWVDAQGRLEVELELHADAGSDLGVVAPADMLMHLRAVLDDELGAKADAQVVLLDAGKLAASRQALRPERQSPANEKRPPSAEPLRFGRAFSCSRAYTGRTPSRASADREDGQDTMTSPCWEILCSAHSLAPARTASSAVPHGVR